MYSFYSCMFPEREASFALRSIGMVFQLTAHIEKIFNLGL